jgi:hypothetical protein
MILIPLPKNMESLLKSMRDRVNSAVSIALLVLSAVPSMDAAQDPAREQARSMVMTQYGVVATLQAVASQAGAAILARGGSSHRGQRRLVGD